MSKKHAKKARWDPGPTGRLKLETQSIASGDYDTDKEAEVKAAKARLDEIKKLLGEPHSVSGLTNRRASSLSLEERQLKALIEQYERRS